MYRYDPRVAILPTGERAKKDTHVPAIPYADDDTVAYLVQKDGASRPGSVWLSSGDLGPEFAVGTWHDAKHDQTWRNLGYFRVVAVLDRYDTLPNGVTVSVFK